MLNYFLTKILRKKCRHASVNEFNPIRYCTDCGKRVELQQIFVKCKKCNSFLTPKLDKAGDVVPLKKFCPNCGGAGWYSMKAAKLNSYLSLYSILVKRELDDDYFTPKTSVWVDGERKSNVIKKDKW